MAPIRVRGPRARGAVSIAGVADKFDMLLAGMEKHVGVLELAGLMTTDTVGRGRTFRVRPFQLEEEMAWIARYCQVWDLRFDVLVGVINELQPQEQDRGRRERK